MRVFRILSVRRFLAVAALTTLLLLTATYLAHAAGGLSLWSAVDSGGGARSSASFRLTDSVAQGSAVGRSSSPQFTLVSGFQAGTAQPPVSGQTYALTIGTVGGGSTSPAAGSYSFPSGTPVSIVAIPASGWGFSHWSGHASGVSNPVTVVMDANKVVTANFAPQGTTLVGAIRQNPAAYEGRAVRISGTYRGWEAGAGPPPVTRGDWVLRDSTGSIYVTGSSQGLRYPGDMGKPVAVNGIVRIKNGQPYIEVPRLR